MARVLQRVRWHLVKDVPNSALRHIRLVQGDKKPVTNSRDAQEVEPSQGMLVLNVFREFRAATTLLDDFEFFGRREKVRREPQAHARRVTAADTRPAAAVPPGRRSNAVPTAADGRTPFHPTGSPAASEFYPGWTYARGSNQSRSAAPAGDGRHRTRAREASGPGPEGNPGGGDGFPPPFARDARGDAADAKENTAGRRGRRPGRRPTRRAFDVANGDENRRARGDGGGGDIGARLPPFRFGVEGESVNA